MKKLIRKYFLVCALLIGASTQAATVGLTAITVSGDNMVNDSVLGVTWAIRTSSASIYPPYDWFSANVFISELNTINHGGHNDWRLASGNGALIPDASNCTAGSTNELGCLFFYELGYAPGTDIVSASQSSPFPFGGAQGYFSGTQASTDKYWLLQTIGFAGQHPISAKDGCCYVALAVRTGLTEVAPVPVPASAWLLLSGLCGLGLMSRKRKN